MAAGWHRFLAGYYVGNALLLACYLYARFVHWDRHGPSPAYSKLESRGSLASKEMQAYPFLLLFLVVKFWKQQSVDQFLADGLKYTKMVIGLMLFYQDFRLLAGFVLASALLWLLAPQPLYQGPTGVRSFTPVEFKEAVLDASNSDVSWLVEVFARWSPACVHLEPVLAQLSLELTTERLKFVRLDVGRWPSLAQQVNVDVSGGAPQQLPTLILFERGKEVSRIPAVFSDGSVAKTRPFRKGDIINAFDLEERASKGAEVSAAKPATGPRRRR